MQFVGLISVLMYMDLVCAQADNRFATTSICDLLSRLFPIFKSLNVWVFMKWGFGLVVS